MYEINVWFLLFAINLSTVIQQQETKIMEPWCPRTTINTLRQVAYTYPLSVATKLQILNAAATDAIRTPKSSTSLISLRIREETIEGSVQEVPHPNLAWERICIPRQQLNSQLYISRSSAKLCCYRSKTTLMWFQAVVLWPSRRREEHAPSWGGWIETISS